MKLRRENQNLISQLQEEHRVTIHWKKKHAKSVVTIRTLKKRISTLKQQLIGYRSDCNAMLKSQKNIESRKIRREVAEVLHISHKDANKSRRKSCIVSKHYRSQVAASKLVGPSRHKKAIRDRVIAFYVEDENSSPSPRVVDTVTRKRVKKRKRFMTDTVANLYKKYRATVENPVQKSLFYFLKPFWVVTKDVNARNTCLCRYHTNFQYMLDRLHSFKIVESRSISDFAKDVCCDPRKKECMLRECHKCLGGLVVADKNLDQKTWYNCWVTSKLKRPGAKGKTYAVTLTERRKIICTIGELIQQINSTIPKFFEHFFVTNHQFQELKRMKENIGMDEVYIIVDFSQNYICKYNEETQAAHFGASKKQISLHTGGFYFKQENGVRGVTTFVTVSEALRHDAGAIWAHLLPILKLIRDTVPNVKIINVQSDGPSAQYKNKNNFYLFRHFCEELKMQNATWNFTAAGHGKSVADAAGANVKSLCDRYVANGNDVLTGDDIVTLVNSKSKIKAYLIENDHIAEIDPLLPQNLKPVPGTLSVHQVVWVKEQEKALFFRSLSCQQCSRQTDCDHHGLRKSTTKYGA